MKKKLAFVLGIRPDVIRAALILKHLRSAADLETVFIWSGQHYSENLKGIFFKELGVEAAEVDLGCSGETDAEVAASVLAKLYPVLKKEQPLATVFLGDTNTTVGAIASAQLNIPIVHIEGGMRSYDWRMPEEKYRTVTDHLSDVIYVYLDEYKEQAVREGINPNNVVVVGNPIVDILEHYYFGHADKFRDMASPSFFSTRGLERQRYYLMTCHRRENVHEDQALDAILALVSESPHPVYFPASYRTQRVIKERGLKLPPMLKIVEPVGYDEFLCLLVNSRGCFTDSGTVVEETCVLGVPSVQMRRSTERPQVYDVGSSVKFDPSEASKYPAATVWAKLEKLHGKTWKHTLGDGKSSLRIAEDLLRRARSGGFAGHKPAGYHLPISHSYREDGLG